MPDVHVKFLGEAVTAREFVMDDLELIYQDNYEQQRALATAPPDAPPPIRWFDRIFDADMVTRKMVELSTGLSPEALQQARPSDLRPLVDAVKEANPDFFSLLARRPSGPATPATP